MLPAASKLDLSFNQEHSPLFSVWLSLAPFAAHLSSAGCYRRLPASRRGRNAQIECEPQRGADPFRQCNELDIGHALATGTSGNPATISTTSLTGTTGTVALAAANVAHRFYFPVVCVPYLDLLEQPGPGSGHWHPHGPSLRWLDYSLVLRRVRPSLQGTRGAYACAAGALVRCSPSQSAAGATHNSPKRVCSPPFQVRAFWDGGGDSIPCTEDDDKICSGYGNTHSDCNLGGHDVMNNLATQLLNQGQESGHCGFPLVDAVQAAADFHNMGVPTGVHTFAMKYHHGANSEAAHISATLNSGNSWSSVSSSSSSGYPQFDVAM